MPRLRLLTYILVGKGLEVVSSRIPRSWTLSWASDHLPLVVGIESSSGRGAR